LQGKREKRGIRGSQHKVKKTWRNSQDDYTHSRILQKEGLQGHSKAGKGSLRKKKWAEQLDKDLSHNIKEVKIDL